MKSDGGNVQKFLEYLATQQDVMCWRVNSGGVAVAPKVGMVATRWMELAPPGTGDIVGYLFHRRLRWAVPFEIEAKSPKRGKKRAGTQRPTQVTRQAELERMNVPYCVADELKDVIQFLEELRES